MGNAFIVKPLPLGTVTAEGSAAGTLPSYLDNDYIGVVHRGTGTASAWIQCDLGSAQAVDVAALLSANAIGAQTVELRGDSDSAVTIAPVYDSGALTFAAGSALPGSGRQNSLVMLPAAQTLRYWLLDVWPLGGSPFEAGRLVLGQKIQLARNFSFGAVRGVRDTSALEFSALGVPLRRRGKKLRTVSIAFESAYKDEVEQSILPLIEAAGGSEPILLVLDPDAHAQRSRRMYFGWLVGDLGGIWRAANGWRFQIDLVSVI